MAHSKLSNVPVRPAIAIWKALSYSLPHTSHFAITCSCRFARLPASRQSAVGYVRVGRLHPPTTVPTARAHASDQCAGPRRIGLAAARGVVTQPLRVWPIDDTDGTFETGGQEDPPNICIIEQQQEAVEANVVE